MRILTLIDDGLEVCMPDGSKQPLWRFVAPVILLGASASLLVVSMLLPYWSMDLDAPQYPEGLRVEVYLNRLEGDVAEIDELNHYLGLPPLEEGGRIERAIAIPAVLGVAALAIATLVIRSRWATPLVLPLVMLPFVFLADLWFILYTYGHSIDPQSALGGAIDPFTPPLFGSGQVGQFASLAQAGVGLILAMLASLVALVGIWSHRAACKALLEARSVTSANARKARRGERRA